MDGPCDVPRLRRFVAAQQQHDELHAPDGEVHPVPRTVVDPALQHARTHAPAVAEVAVFHALDRDVDPGASPGVRHRERAAMEVACRAYFHLSPPYGPADAAVNHG